MLHCLELLGLLIHHVGDKGLKIGRDFIGVRVVWEVHFFFKRSSCGSRVRRQDRVCTVEVLMAEVTKNLAWNPAGFIIVEEKELPQELLIRPTDQTYSSDLLAAARPDWAFVWVSM